MIMPTIKTIKIYLKGRIQTDIQGHQSLLQFYYACKIYKDCQIEIDLTNLRWFDANLSGLLLAITEDLRESNKLDFHIDGKYWLSEYSKNFNVLLRNKFIPMLWGMGDGYDEIVDNHKSTIELQKFHFAEIDEFSEYIERVFLEHRGCSINEEAKEDIRTAYTELFTNYREHAETEKPIYVCGQYFPTTRKLCFSITDVGIGFFVPIQKHTQTDENPVNNAQTAIEWALKYNNTTSISKTKGQGLHNIEKFCKENNGDFHIISDNIYTYHQRKKRNFKILDRQFKGVTIHLFFSN